MKKFSLALNLALVCLTGCLTVRVVPEALTPNNCERFCSDFSNAGRYDLIDGMLLDRMAKLYQDGMADKNKDGQSVWYSLADLKRFIWEIESSACKSKCENLRPVNLGIRIYYAKYPQTGTLNSHQLLRTLPVEYMGMHTLFMVPTYDASKSNVHTDFNLLDNDRPQDICIQKIIRDSLSIGPVGALFPDGKNHGPLCPPNDCEGAIFSSFNRK